MKRYTHTHTHATGYTSSHNFVYLPLVCVYLFIGPHPVCAHVCMYVYCSRHSYVLVGGFIVFFPAVLLIRGNMSFTLFRVTCMVLI